MKPIPPLFMHEEPGPRITVVEAAESIREPGEDVKHIAAQIRTFLARRHVHVRDFGGTWSTATQYLAPCDIAVARVLRVLVSSVSVADNELLGAASRACYDWTKDRAKRARHHHPITDALFGFTQGEFWHFRADLMVDDQTGARRIVANVYNPEVETISVGDPADSSVPVGTILIPIYAFAPRIIAAMNAAKGN